LRVSEQMSWSQWSAQMLLHLTLVTLNGAGPE
jgi:hypothetical protein